MEGYHEVPLLEIDEAFHNKEGGDEEDPTGQPVVEDLDFLEDEKFINESDEVERLLGQIEEAGIEQDSNSRCFFMSIAQALTGV